MPVFQLKMRVTAVEKNGLHMEYKYFVNINQSIHPQEE
jgi:hypothetical protein